MTWLLSGRLYCVALISPHYPAVCGCWIISILTPRRFANCLPIYTSAVPSILNVRNCASYRTISASTTIWCLKTPRSPPCRAICALGGCLNILGTGITHLPEDLYVGERLLLDAEKMTSNVAWRHLRTAELPPNPLFSPTNGNNQRDMTVYAVSLAGEIKISAGRFYGSPSAFMRNNPPQLFRQRVLECVEELNQNAMIG